MSGGELYGLIMAGGRGTRFWPVSTRSNPKQFLNLLDDSTMLQMTAERLRGLCPDDHVLVVTGSSYRKTVAAQLPWIPEENVLLEPMGRNTAPCIAWGAQALSRRAPDGAVMLVVPSDHSIDDKAGFESTVRVAVNAAEKGYLTTIGVPPTRPATGYGYLKRGKRIMDGAWKVAEFKEKPDLKTARDYLDQGCYLWNAGMFVWKVEEIIGSMRSFLPDLAEGVAGLGEVTFPSADRYRELPSVSVDYGIMEKASNVAMVEALFGWDDVGDWPAMRRVGVRKGEVILQDCGSCTVYGPGRLTVLLGMSDCSVVHSNGITLVMSDEHAQDLKKLVARLEKERPDLV
ncbi:NTP transferase domain-containing protein [Candidatus Fermentibacteria bacterium]|nr:NTP transferase domain-containing protein [Candidatus Fermentibacteria bacterium]